MKKLLAGLVVVLAIGSGVVGGSVGAPREAHAAPTAAVMIPKSACIALFTGSIGDIALGCLQNPKLFHDSFGGTSSFAFAKHLGDGDGTLEPEDLTGIGTFGGNQLHDKDGYAFIVIFVDDQGPVKVTVDPDGGDLNAGNNALRLNSTEYICDTTAEDSDCDDQNDASDNGFIVVALCSGPQALGCNTGGTSRTASRGSHRLSIEQERFPIDVDYTVVGEPANLELQVFETTINNGIEDLNGDHDFTDSDECPLAASVAGFSDALNTAPKTVVIGRVTDKSGQGIVGAWVSWSTSDRHIGSFTGTVETPTLNLGGFGFGAPQILCGTEKPGILEIRAKVVDGPSAAALDPCGGVSPPDNCDRATPNELIDVQFDVTVRGVPKTVTTVANPVTIPCDGTTTSEVSATVLDVNGEQVANGWPVFFSSQLLATANPIKATTGDGVAKTTITPLRSQEEGVTIVATAGTVESAVLVKCGPGVPGGAVVSDGAPGGGAAAGGSSPQGIRGPDTGSGGFAGTGALSWWPALALLAGAIALAGAQLASRRR